MKTRLLITVSVLLFGMLSTGCSVRRFAVNKLGDSLANSGTVYAADNDPELIGSALPFSLKLIDGLLAESPKHRGLLLAACSGYTQYAYIYVQQPAEELEERDVARAAELRLRARKLYLRARDYCLRGLELKRPGFAQSLREAPPNAARTVQSPADVALLYWTAASWGAAIAVSKDHPELVAEQPAVEALIDRAYELNPNFDHGAIHGFLITYEGARQGARISPAERARRHFERAVELSGGQMAAYYVSYAETKVIDSQDRSQFESLLQQALAIDADARPEWRLANLVYQRRARWLLSREDELFLSADAACEARGTSACTTTAKEQRP